MIQFGLRLHDAEKGVGGLAGVALSRFDFAAEQVQIVCDAKI